MISRPALVAFTLGTVSFALSSTLPAQSPTLVSESAAQLYATTSFSSGRPLTYPAGTSVEHALRAYRFSTGTASASLDLENQGDRIRFDIMAAATGSSSLATVSDGSVPNGACRWLWSLPGAGAGTFRIVSNATASAGTTASVMVDVGADGSVEYAMNGAHQSSIDIPAPSVPTRGRVVRISVLATASGSNDYERSSLSLSLAYIAPGGVVPADFATISNQIGCGPELYGADSSGAQHALALSVVRGRPGALALLMLGLAPQVPELPLPQNPSCALWIQPLLFGAGTLDHGGEARWTIVTPPPIRGEILHAQVATLDLPTASLQTSSALRVAFPNR